MEEIKKIMRTLRAIEQGTRNFYIPKDRIEDLARQRIKECNCLVDPNKSDGELKIIDKRIPELSGKVCGECSCIAPFKFRQSIDKCKNWSK